MVLIIGAHIFCASVGDSRAVLCRNGKAVNLSLDQKASRPDEVERITKKQGYIEFGRVGNKLAITRAFGDFEFKYEKDEEGQNTVFNDIITSKPEIRRYDYDPNKDEFIILASDGLFDMFKSQEAVSFVRDRMHNQKKHKQIFGQNTDRHAMALAHESIYVRNVRDNVTVLVIALNRGYHC